MLSDDVVIYTPNTPNFKHQIYESKIYKYCLVKSDHNPLAKATHNINTSNLKPSLTNSYQLKKLDLSTPFIQASIKNPNQDAPIINNIIHNEPSIFPAALEQSMSDRMNKSTTLKRMAKLDTIITKCCKKKCFQHFSQAQIHKARVDFIGKPRIDQRNQIENMRTPSPIQRLIDSSVETEMMEQTTTDIIHDEEIENEDEDENENDTLYEYLLRKKNAPPRTWQLQGITVCAAFMKQCYFVSNDSLWPRKQRISFNSRTDAAVKRLIVMLYLDNAAKYQEILPNKKDMIQFSIKHHDQLYQMFRDDHSIPNYLKSSKSYFLYIWRTYRPNYKIRRILQFSKCDACESLRAEWGKTNDVSTKNALQAELMKHVTFVQNERMEYWRKRCWCERNSDHAISIIVDGTDQGSWGVPYFRQKTKLSEKYYKLRTHITGAIVHGHRSYIYTCDFNYEHGTNLQIEILQRILIDVEKQYAKKQKVLPDICYLQLDNTAKENRNKILFSYLCHLVLRGVFKTICISFLPVGHTHEVICIICY
jgi:hypothetical protein